MERATKIRLTIAGALLAGTMAYDLLIRNRGGDLGGFVG